MYNKLGCNCTEIYTLKKGAAILIPYHTSIFSSNRFINPVKFIDREPKQERDSFKSAKLKIQMCA